MEKNLRILYQVRVFVPHGRIPTYFKYADYVPIIELTDNPGDHIKVTACRVIMNISSHN
jgi:hypothetical protein